MKRILCLCLVLALALSLGACGSKRGEDAAPDGPSAGTGQTAAVPTVTIPEPVAATETEPGYRSTVIPPPDWVEDLGRCEALGDVLYIVARTTDGGLAVAGYDTVNDSWQRIDIDLSPLPLVDTNNFCVTDGALWLLLREERTDAELERRDYSRNLDYYLIHVDLTTGEQRSSHVDFWQEGKPYLLSLIALDSQRALIGDDNQTRLISPDAQVIATPALRIPGMGFHARVGGEIWLDSVDGLACLNAETLQFERAIPELKDRVLYGSTLGNLLFSEEKELRTFDPATGEKSTRFNWLDVALSYEYLRGNDGMENSKGEIIHRTDQLIRVAPAQVPLRKTLTLACFGDASDPNAQYASTSYTCPASLMDAVVRFNSTDVEYKIELRPLIYHNDAERSRLLMELATGGGVDLVDTSLLPEGAIDKELLVDLLPYIDADPSLSRDDFLPGVLTAMTRTGGLYEYMDKVTILTMVTRPDFAEGGWTAETISGLARQYPGRRWDNRGVHDDNRGIITRFLYAATGEFMDWDSMTCRFDSEAFIGWLRLLKAMESLPAAERTDGALFASTFNFVGNECSHLRASLRGDYTPVGFPDAAGSGSYFMKLGTVSAFGGAGAFPDGEWGSGSHTSLGILASGENRDGAWRFVRTFIQGEAEPNLACGIPVLKESFERTVDAWVEWMAADEGKRWDSDYAMFNEADAEDLRNLVYNTDRFVCADGPVIDTLEAAVTAFLGGKGTAEETAAQIQSRLTLYMAERA